MIKLFIVQFLSASEPLSLFFSINQVSHTCNITGKIIVLCVLIFILLDIKGEENLPPYIQSCEFNLNTMVLYKSLLTKWYLQNHRVPQSENTGSRKKFYGSEKNEHHYFQKLHLKYFSFYVTKIDLFKFFCIVSKIRWAH